MNATRQVLSAKQGGIMDGYMTGEKEVIEILRRCSRPYLFSNSLALPIEGSIKVFQPLDKDTSSRDKLRPTPAIFKNGLKKPALTLIDGDSAIAPIMLCDAKPVQKWPICFCRKGHM